MEAGFADEVVSADAGKGESEENILTLAKAKVTTTQGQMKAMSAKEFMGKIAACVATRESAGGGDGTARHTHALYGTLVAARCDLTEKDRMVTVPLHFAPFMVQGAIFPSPCRRCSEQ